MSEGTKSRLPVWLIVSLLANALLIGVLIGGGLGQRKAGPPVVRIGGEDALMRGIDRAVPADQRRLVRLAFRRAFTDSRQERIRVREARQALTGLLAAEDYQAAKVQEGFAELRTAEAAMKGRMHDVLAEQLGALSVEQRRSILSDFNRPRGGRGQGREEGIKQGRGDRSSPPKPFRDREKD
ncbi:MAG: periplasmic heavy metal sensor [Pseudomonadota bacterium]